MPTIPHTPAPPTATPDTITVSGTAATTTAIASSPSTEKILVIEDDFYFSDLIASAMSEQGLEYDLVVRASNSPAGISFMHPDGKTEILDLSRYWLILCDSQLKGSQLQGIDLAAAMSAQGHAVIAISGMDSLNDSMVKAGAHLGIRKDNLWINLYKGEINLRDLVQTAKAKRQTR